MKNAVYRERERRLEMEELAGEILSLSRNELYLSLRFLDRALSTLRFVPRADLSLAGTDGVRLFYQTDALIRLFDTDPRLTNRMYLHIIMHCLFEHPFVRPPSGSDRKTWERKWDLACDVTAEYLTDGLYLPCLSRPKSALRLNLYQDFRKKGIIVSAQNVFRLLPDPQTDPDGFSALEREFRTDDHRFWHTNASSRQQTQMLWRDIRERMQTELETFSREASASSQVLTSQIRTANQRRYDYRRFLRRFSVLREEMQVDPDSFDYIYYHYGMQHYRNMPLIEPLETREVYRIEEFVLVLDTSMSCDGRLIRRFLEETWSVLSEQETYCRKFHIRIIQCDDQVRQDTLITCQEELEAYRSRFTVIGKGGTDFRPAFAYVNGLVAKGVFHHLRGLLYFTDGYGIYPVKRPVYETAFIFLKEDYRDADVPPWAIRLILDPASIEQSIQ